MDRTRLTMTLWNALRGRDTTACYSELSEYDINYLRRLGFTVTENTNPAALRWVISWTEEVRRKLLAA
jgi:hypothetical protein